MEARELRIGNYFSTGQGDNIAKVTPNIIEALCESENRSWINPIPLTEEWLLKFGFVFDRIDKVYYLTGCDDSFHVVNETGFGLSIGATCYGFLSSTEHVHQLQNLYFALTGEELEITKTK
jgi:hypothetical protein